MTLLPHDRLLFVGDSVTASGRRLPDANDLGQGYVSLVAAELTHRRPELALTVANRGVNGDTSPMVQARWAHDVLTWRPTVISLLVGVNDTWRTMTSGPRLSTATFEDHVRRMLAAARERFDARFVLVEPFIVPVTPAQVRWRPDLELRIAAVHRLAAEVGATVVPADEAFTAAALDVDPATLCADGVHPTPTGHALLARTWLDAVGI